MDTYGSVSAEAPSVKQSYTTSVLDFVSVDNTSNYLHNEKNIDIICCTNNDVIVAMKYPSVLYVEGIVEVSCILGNISVLGYVVRPDNGKFTVYSLPPDNALGIHSLRLSLESDEFMLSKLIQKGINFMPATRAISKVKDGGVVLMLSRSNVAEYELWMNMLKRNGFDLYPIINSTVGELTRYETILNCRLDSGNRKDQCRFEVCDSWQDLYTKVNVTSLDPQTRVSDEDLGLRIAVCGGKSVGKSSLLRYLVNSALNNYEAVVLFDFDIGQSECTMPGCISATIIDQPLIGPNFTHLKNPIRSFYLGHVDTAKCSNMYINAVQTLMEYCEKYHTLHKMPWFANTMGFCHGMGTTLAAVVLANFNPSYVVQIHSKTSSNNFPSLLTPVYVMKQYKGPKNLSYKVETYESIAEGIQRISKSQAYIMLSGDTLSFINYDVLRPGDLVVLTDSSQEDIVKNCLGFGIIVNHNYGEEEVYVQGFIKEYDISRIKGIIIGSIQVPESIVKNNPDLMGTVSYFLLRTFTREPLSGLKRQTKCLFSRYY